MGNKKKLTEKDIKRYRKKLANPVYRDNAIGKIADDWADKICKANLIKRNSEIIVAEKQTSTEEKRMARLTLNEHLFEVLEDLTDKAMQGEALESYIKRAETTVKVSQQIIANNNTILNVIKIANECGIDPSTLKQKLKQITE